MKTPGSIVRVGLLVAGFLGLGSAAEGKVSFVAKTGNDANDGLSWATAKVTVQAGLNAAAAGDEVWVAAGTYVEQVTLTTGAALYGGFTGNETDRVQRDWKANETILDGNAAGSVVTSPAGATPATRIDGFTIRNGSARLGGGIVCDSSSPTITNNTITGNRASWLSSDPAIQAGYGGGVFCRSASPVIKDNTIRDNIALDLVYPEYPASQGGGICCDASSPTIEGNTIRRNYASWGAGIACCNNSVPVISHNRITENNSTYFYSLGGGIYCSASAATILNNIIAANATGGMGGGIYGSSSALTIVNNTIACNSASDQGGGIACSSASPAIANTIIAFNSSGVYAEGGTPSLRSNCVYGNANYDYSGMIEPTGTNGNLSADPGLADAAYGNTHLQPDSLCVDAGDDSVVQAGWQDMDGQPRIAGTHVDIGADESDGTTWARGPYVIVRVSPDGNDANDGSSWSSAKRSVQAAMEAAAGSGGEVWVGAGTYTERIRLRPFVYLYGGFGGTETQRQQRDWRSHASTLVGVLGSVPVVSASSVGFLASTVDGFTVRGGNEGGIDCGSGAPIIANNVITANTSSSNGGGIRGASPATIINNTITGNSAWWYGGGIHYAGASFGIIANNTVSGNSAIGGGGIYCSGSPTITNTIVAFNSSGIYQSKGVPSLRANCVYGNTYYDFSGLPNPAGSDGNIAVDPGFAAAAYGNVHLQPGSPCIDAGDDAAVQAGWVDMDVQTRMIGAHVDIGADESDGTVWPQESYAIVRVSPEGSDFNDGSSWRYAKRTVQAAIDAASRPGGEVWVKAGTYLERITLRSHVYVYGGFAGTETQREQRDWHNHISVLDGQGAGSVVIATYTGYRMGAIDGFTIRNGDDNIYSQYGGGIYVKVASPIIANNTITDNRATGGGAGIYCYTSIAPWIRGNTIANNTTAASGAGVLCLSSAPTIEDNTFTNNGAGSGGAIYSASSSPRIVRNTIKGNRATSGGGVYCTGEAYPLLVEKETTIASNTISGNEARFGGGIYAANYVPMRIVNSVVTGNRATQDGGGLYCYYPSASTIVNSTIVGNESTDDGGGICNYGIYPLTIANTLIAFNSSGILNHQGTLSVRFSCVYGNAAYGYSGLTDPTGTDGNISVNPSFMRSPSPGPDGKSGTTDDDLGDLHLNPGSPCIDAGDNGAVPPGVLADLDGEPRFLNDPATPDTGAGIAPIVDMGAYEYLPYLPGDFNRDHRVDKDDLKMFTACVSGSTVSYSGDCAGADFDKDGDVDASDFGFIQRCFTEVGKPIDPTCAN